MVQFEPEHIGRRVTVRSLTGGIGPTGGPQASDVVGRLIAVDERSLTVERRDGSHAQIDRSRVVAARLIPSRPQRRRRAMQTTADDLTGIAARGWPAAIVERLGDWELRASGGFTRRANSVLVTGDPGVPFTEAQEAVVEFAGQHGIGPLAQVVAESSWHRVFIEAGWQPDSSSGPADVLVQVVDLGDVPADGEVSISPVADDDWLRRYGRTGDAQLARSVLEGPERVGFATLDQRAIGRVAVTGEWAGLAAVTVDPAHRRQGLGGRVVSALLAWAAARDADKAYLQVESDNAAAIALYRRFGFSTHHRYLYLRPPSGDR